MYMSIKKIFRFYFHKIHWINKYMQKRLSPKYYIHFATYILPPLLLKIPNFKLKFDLLPNNKISIEYNEDKKLFFSLNRIKRYTVANSYGKKSSGFFEASLKLIETYQLNNIEIEESDSIIEIGANIGELTSFFITKSNQVFCFEIDPIALECLKFNCPTAKIIEKAASNKTGEFNLYLHSLNASSSLIPNFDSQEKDSDNNCITVPTQRLDDFMKIQSIEKVKLLKIEAEGAEPEVLMGLGDRIKDIGYIAIDAGPERFGKSTVSEVVEILEKNGFQIKTRNFHVIGCNSSVC